MILLLLLQAETDRIANEIQIKKEKEMQEFREEKAKMVTSLISMQEFVCIETESFPLPLFLFRCIQLASAIISVHILYLKLL